MYNCKIVADSISPLGVRLTTFEVTYPLIIHAEVMTHRVFSRNVASNRAIPVKKLIDSVKENPFVPVRFPKNQAGMQNSEWLEGEEHIAAEAQWLYARDQAVKFAENLNTLGVHKQIANRLLAPFLWTTAVITATEWNNFFGLRCHPAAQPEIQTIAYMMKEAYTNTKINFVNYHEWHLPYTSDVRGKYDLADLQRISIGRCARVSYLNHGENNTPEKDIELCDRLIDSKHLSPTEHVAYPAQDEKFYGNLRGWKQFRLTIANESGQ